MKLSFGNLASTKKTITIIVIVLILLSIPIAVYLVQQRQEIRKKAVETGEGQLVCDSGPNPYDSDTIVVTNNSTQSIDNVLVSNIFRCEYSPGRVVEGFYSCETQTECDKKADDENTHCQVGLWDQEASVIDFSLSSGQTRTMNVTANPCEIVQIDVYNKTVHETDDPTECYNIGSQGTNPAPPNRWPGGIAFGIKQNPEGYNQTTGTCPAPTSTPTPTPTSTPVVTGTPPPTATPSPTPSGTPPVGQPPTNTPTPSSTPTVPNTPTPTITPIPPAGSTPTPTSPPPVSGNNLPTIITIAGGLILVVVALLL